jgi:ribosomal protein L3
MREMVLPEDELKIFDETLETRLEDTDQQLKKWMLTSEDKSIGSRKISKRKHATSKKMSKKTPLITKMFMKMGKKRSTSRNKEVLEVEKQIIDDRYGNVPVELLAR